MKKSLVLAEKPSVGREIARVLGCNQKGNGCFIGSQYIVTWALGHLVTLADPEAYEDRYKTWRIDDLPMLPAKMELVVIKETSKQYSAVKQLLRLADIDELIIATDAGREGELVARWILQKAGWHKPIKRLWISSQTDKAIKEGFKNLKPGQNYENLYAAAECRAHADWYVGINVTRALTCKYNAQLSAGRVQTPTLALIVERENEIKRFVPKEYWTIQAFAQGFFLRWQDKNNGQMRLFDVHKAESLLAKLRGQSGVIVDIKKEGKKELPPLAYDLTELQRDANRKYGYSAKKTSSIMQELYEHYKIVTYPRTDSRYLTEDIVPTLPERLQAVEIGPYAKSARNILHAKITTTKRLVDNAKVTDHHAIIPTEEYVNLAKLSQDEYRIYDLIVRRFLAVLSPVFEYEQTTVKVEIQGEIFTAKGKIVKHKGWRSAYDGSDTKGNEDECEYENEYEYDDKEQSLPDLKVKDKINILSVKSITGQTKPPKRYTEAALLSAMEGPGLGTPATRADIIEKLFNSFYMERREKEIIPTSKGIQLIDLVPSELKSPELTSKWEKELSEISQGREKQQTFIHGITGYAGRLVSEVIASSQTFHHDNITRTKCPECGKYLLQVKGKRGEMLVCQDRECGYRHGISVHSNARCPQCHKKMELRGEGEQRLFTCTCGYREKLSAFTQRKDQEGKGKVNKKDVHKYMQNQKKDIPINTALADALAKLNLKK